MKHDMFAVYDSKGKFYTTPFYDIAAGRALRTFTDLCNDKTHAFGKHPEDYVLYQVGTYDDDTGSITQDKISSIAQGNTLIGA